MATRRILSRNSLWQKNLLRNFYRYFMQDARVLLAKGNLARTIIAEKINQAGANCDEVIVYETVLPKESVPSLVHVLRAQRSECDYVYKFVNHSSFYANRGTISVAPTFRKSYHCMYRAYCEENSAINMV